MQLRVEELDRQKSILEKEVKRLYGRLPRAKIGISSPFFDRNMVSQPPLVPSRSAEQAPEGLRAEARDDDGAHGRLGAAVLLLRGRGGEEHFALRTRGAGGCLHDHRSHAGRFACLTVVIGCGITYYF